MDFDDLVTALPLPPNRVGKRLAPRCAQAGIEIALVKDRGEIIKVSAA